MDKFTGLKDVDREVLKHVDDRELLQACSVDRRMWNEVCDDNFLQRRLKKYGNIEKYKKEESWKRFYLRVIYYISMLKEKYQYEYTEGDFEKQYRLLHDNKSMNKLLIESAALGELSLVKYALKNGAYLHFFQDGAVSLAAGEGHLDIVKYLVNLGSGIPPYSLIEAAANGHFKVVKYLIEEKNVIPTEIALTRAILFGRTDIVRYLIERGVDIHTENDYALRWAAKNGDLELVKFLMNFGANIHAENDFALLWAVENGHFDIVRYLVEHGADIYTYNKKALQIAKEFKHQEIYDYLFNLY
jgi:ankyrin repeat protein